MMGLKVQSFPTSIFVSNGLNVTPKERIQEVPTVFPKEKLGVEPFCPNLCAQEHLDTISSGLQLLC